ncbi:hypothetical protein [Demequina salsinemoris]|uniref:hypothetical protein n=1 Tax=Demequina salsinemoris TaxID=577470 RepID=UPI000B1F1704|nr:hypothetical protein [Demequina salsinemoris]
MTTSTPDVSPGFPASSWRPHRPGDRIVLATASSLPASSLRHRHVNHGTPEGKGDRPAEPTG